MIETIFLFPNRPPIIETNTCVKKSVSQREEFFDLKFLGFVPSSFNFHGCISHETYRALFGIIKLQHIMLKTTIFHEMNLRIFKMFTDKGFEDVNNSYTSDKVSF